MMRLLIALATVCCLTFTQVQAQEEATEAVQPELNEQMGSKIVLAETLEISAAPETIWQTIGDFNSISVWHPVVFSSEIQQVEKSDASPMGINRLLTLGKKDGPTILEALQSMDEAGRSYSYTILEVDPAVLPVTEYSASITVEQGEDSKASIVRWEAQFMPVPADNYEDAEKAVRSVFTAGLQSLKAMSK